MKQFILRLSTAVLAALVIVGCAQESNPVEATNTQRTGDAANPLIFVANDPFVVTMPEYDSTLGSTTVTERISSADGGNIKMKVMYFNKGQKQLSISAIIKFPPGALDQDRDITLSLDPQWLGFEFLPHGIQFSSPVSLTIDTYGLDLTNFNQGTDLWYVDNGNWAQSFQGANVIVHVDQGKLMVTDIPLEHFSRYAFGR